MRARYRFKEGRPKPHLVIINLPGRKERSTSYSTEEEALGIVAAINDAEQSRDAWLQGGVLSIDTVAEGWFQTYKPTMSRSTRETNLGLLTNYIKPHFGDTDLRTLDEAALIDFIDSIMQRNKKGSAVAINAVSILRTICSHYLKAGILNGNPAQGAKALVSKVAAQYETEVRQVNSWTHDEMHQILAIAEKHEAVWYPPLLCLFHTGMRRGEMIGLRWSSVDFTRRRISIISSRVRQRNKMPKSGKARQVPMSPRLYEVLSDLADTRKKREGQWTDPGYVFLSPRGKQWDETNFSRGYRRLRQRFAEKKIRPLRLHDMRHTFTTLAIEGRRSIMWVSQVLGHHDPALTLRTYAHVLERENDDMGFLESDVNIRDRSGTIRDKRST